MDKIKISVSGNIAVVAEKPKRITSGTTGLPVEFTFDSEWDELRKVAVFDACCVRKDMIIKDGATVVPIENLSTHGACLCIGVYGVNEDGSVAIPTIWANAGMIYPGAVPEGDLGSDIGTAKEQYDEAVLASERSENAANRAEAAAINAETDAGLANDAAFRADAAMVSSVSASESAQQSAQRAGASEEYIDIQKYKIDQSVAEAKNAQHYAEEAQKKAETAADRAEAAGGGSGGGTIIVGIDEGNTATHTALEIYDAIQNEKTVVFRYTGRLIDEFVPLKISKTDLAVFSKAGYPTEFDIFDIEIDNSGTISYNTHFSSALVNQAVEKVETDLAPVSYLPQTLSPEQQAQARDNIGAVDEAYVDNAVKGKAYERIDEFTLDETAALDLTEEPDGTPYAFDAMLIIGKTDVGTTSGEMCFTFHNSNSRYYKAYINAVTSGNRYFTVELYCERGRWIPLWLEDTNQSIGQVKSDNYGRATQVIQRADKFEYITGVKTNGVLGAGSNVKIYAIRHEGV